MRLIVFAAAAALAAPALPVAAQTVDPDPVFADLAPDGPGCVVGLAQPGRPVVRRAYGLADLEHPDPLTPASTVEAGSLAKQFTAAAVVLLAQDGRLRLDDDIRLYLPEMPDYGAPITIRHLLTHTSGLREQWSLLALTGNPPGMQAHSQAMILDLASRQRGLNFRPGDEYLYTNTNYVLAAIIVARVSGESLPAFTARRLFGPLGMTHTRWRDDFRAVVPGRATAYAPTDDGFIANMPFTNVHGNGGLLTTVDDLLRWNAFLEYPSNLPGGAALVAALQTPGRLNDGTVLGYGLGLEVGQAHGRPLIAHSGSTGGYKSWLGRYPGTGVSVAVLCNNGGVDAVERGETLAARALGVADAPPAAPPPASPAITVDLTPYPGLFRNPVTGELAQTRLTDGRLTLTQGRSQDLTPLGEGVFRRADGDGVRFVMNGNAPAELILSRAASRSRYVAVPPPLEGPDALNAYVGTYYSEELDTRISVVRQGEALVMRQAFAVEWPLTARFADGFSTPLRGSTTFVFTRDADGAVTGFKAWATGARGVPFARR